MSFQERLDRCCRVNRRVEESFFAHWGLKRRLDNQMEAALLVWSIETPEGRLAWWDAQEAEEPVGGSD